MARIRTVKPELFKHVGLFDAEIYYQLPLRLAFIALFTCCDRQGRFRWDPRRLKLDLLPYDEIDISHVLDALVGRGFVVKYEHQNEIFGCIPSWQKHQHINHREIDSDIPALEGSISSIPEKSSQNNQLMVKELSVNDACPTRELRVIKPSRACPGGIWNREGNRERNVEGSTTIVASGMRPDVDENPIQIVFSHWKMVMMHPQAKLDPKRRRLIGKALGFGYDIQALCDAITGCSVTPHNQGHNDRNQRYDGLHVILRDSDQIDRFIHNYHYPPKLISEAERKTKANVDSLQRWMDKKIAEECNHANV